MTEPNYGSDRETIWGISRKDRPWFQFLTLLGGIAGSVTLAALALEYPPDGSTPSTIALNIVLGIGGSFVASGFIAWGMLQSKELAMSIAGWINDRRAKNRAKLRAEGREEGYALGYDDAQSGRPRQMGAATGDSLAQDDRAVRTRRTRRPLRGRR